MNMAYPFGDSQGGGILIVAILGPIQEIAMPLEANAILAMKIMTDLNSRTNAKGIIRTHTY